MSIYVKTGEGVARIEDLDDRVSTLEGYESAGGGDICTVASSNVNINYLYFKRYGKVVTVFGRIGIGKFPGIWNSSKNCYDYSSKMATSYGRYQLSLRKPEWHRI